MLKNYFLIAWRQTILHPTFSFINIFGLALSMSVCLLLILLIKDAYSYDRFHHNSDRVYRINTEAIRKNGGTEAYATSPYPVADALKRENPFIETVVFCNSPIVLEFDYNNTKIEGRSYFSDQSFFEVFNFPLATGIVNTALDQPNSIILTSVLADKLFPPGDGQDALGKVVTCGSLGTFKVTGVMKPILGKTHLDFDAVFSLSSVPALVQSNQVSSTFTDWNNYYENLSYVKLKPDASMEAIESTLVKIVETNYKEKVLESRDAGYRFYLQPLNKITPGPILSNGEGKGLPKILLWVLSALAGIILLSSLFNYTSISIARASYRLKEIAMRKVSGSQNSAVFGQVMIESIFNSLLALIVSIGLLFGILPKIKSTSFITSAEIEFNIGAEDFIYFILIAIVVGIIGGILPGITLSKLKPISLFNDLQNTKLFKRVGLRNALLCIQLIICLIFVNIIYIMNKQLNHSTLVNFGYGHTQVYNMDLQGQSYDLVSQKIKQIPGVEKVSAISHLMGNYSDYAHDVRINKDQEKIGVRDYFVDDKYLDNFNLELLAGKNFESNPGQQNERELIVNEEFLRKFKLGSPAEAIGKGVIIGDSTLLAIYGVVKDFLFKPSDYALEPLMLRYNPASVHILNIRLNKTDPQKSVAQIEAAWKEIDPHHPLSGRFYDQEITRAFKFINDALLFVTFIAFLGIIITCLGLLGMTIYVVQKRTKEIALRKIVGANLVDIITILSKSYLKIILVAILISTPLVILLGKQILNQYAQKIAFNPFLVLPGILLVLLVTTLTVGSQTLKASRMNPVDSIRKSV